MIMEFAQQQKLVVCNSYFKKEVGKFVTYESGGCKSMLDYVLTRSGDRKVVTNWNSVGGLECVRQHKLVWCDMGMGGPVGGKRRYEPKIKVWKLREDDTREKYMRRVEEGIQENEMRKAQEVNELSNSTAVRWL